MAKRITAREVAEQYGLKVSRNGMACCPFHNDRNPSMKLDERYYCFGCQATGDAVDMAAKLLNLKPREAALQICCDFGISEKCFPVQRQDPSSRKVQRTPKSNDVIDLLIGYLSLLRKWETEYVPQYADSSWHPRFTQALSEKSKIEYMLDELMSGNEQERLEFLREYESEVSRIERLMEQSSRGNAERDCGCAQSTDTEHERQHHAKHGKLRDGPDL